MPPVHYGSFKVRDYSSETSTVKFYNGAITAVSLPGYLTALGNMRTAIQGVTNGIIASEMWVGDNTVLSQAAPATPIAQRENKWLVTYEGNTNNKLFQMTLPTADLTNAALFLPGSDEADLTAQPWVDFITAFQAIGRTPDDDQETITVRSIRFVGRNI